MNDQVAQALLEQLAPCGDSTTNERVWRFSQRMTSIYQQQMEAFDNDEDARRWREFYSVRNMPPPDETRNKAEVAAQMAFYFPTHFFKFQKVATQQLLETHFSQRQVNPYPFGAPNITLIDIGAGLVSDARPPAKKTGIKLIAWNGPFRCSCCGD